MNTCHIGPLLRTRLVGSYVFARQISQLWQTHKSPLQHSTALLGGSLWIHTEAKRSFGFGFQVVQVKLPEREGERGFR